MKPMILTTKIAKEHKSLLGSTIALFLLSAILCGTETIHAQQLKRSNADRVAEIGMVVTDMDQSVAFYFQVLTFEKISDVEVYGTEYEHLEGLFGVRIRVVRMRLGDEILELTQFLAPQGRPIPIDSRANDRWFQHVAIITSDMDSAYSVLRAHNVKHASTSPQSLPAYITSAAGIRAFYFRDPDNHFLEILQFPPDKGATKWHALGSKLFLGIDHTAIVVADTDESLRFYRDGLGMDIAGESENYGTEQEHLNNVFGARLRITSLRTPSGPGIELLEYLAPRDGRPMPRDSHANDLWAWETTISTSSVAEFDRELRSARADFVSSGVIELLDSTVGFNIGFLVRDPDGHILRVIRP
jgi:catechol 2,3-dioxygenase-like lactoylglutathione lyase family enzyme